MRYILAFLVAVNVAILYFVLKYDVGGKVYILDVGQGDSILIRTIDNRYVLIDSGPDDKALAQIQEIIPFWQRKIDVLILTHPDQDHVGGFGKIMDYYSFDYVFYTEMEHANSAYFDFQRKAEASDAVVMALDMSKDFKFGCCSYFDILFPTNLENLNEDVNDNSTAFVFMYNDFAGYFGGDLPIEYEDQILIRSGYDLDLIKVGHHGSNTSTSNEIIEATHPEVAVISCGYDNRFGHPHDEVLDILERNNMEIRRTDLEGRVEVDVDDGW